MRCVCFDAWRRDDAIGEVARGAGGGGGGGGGGREAGGCVCADDDAQGAIAIAERDGKRDFFASVRDQGEYSGDHEAEELE